LLKVFAGFLILAIPACASCWGGPPIITPDSLISWDRPAVDERIGWQLCVDEHPCVDLGPISAKSSDGIRQTYQSPFWSDRVARYLTPGTHRLSVAIYRVSDRSLVSPKSEPLPVRVAAKSRAGPR